MHFIVYPLQGEPESAFKIVVFVIVEGEILIELLLVSKKRDLDAALTNNNVLIIFFALGAHLKH